MGMFGARVLKIKIHMAVDMLQTQKKKSKGTVCNLSYAKLVLSLKG